MVSNILTGLPAFPVGSWYLSRNVYNLMIDAGLTEFLKGSIDPQIAIVTFVILTLLALYLYPAALILIARSQNLRDGLSLRHLVNSTARLEYVRAWLQAIVSLALGSALLLAWNYWRSQPTREPIRGTTTFLEIGDFSLITFPTTIGIQSSLLLFLVGTGNVLLLLRAYYRLAMAIPDSQKPEVEEIP